MLTLEVLEVLNENAFFSFDFDEKIEFGFESLANKPVGGLLGTAASPKLKLNTFIVYNIYISVIVYITWEYYQYS